MVGNLCALPVPLMLETLHHVDQLVKRVDGLHLFPLYIHFIKEWSPTLSS